MLKELYEVVKERKEKLPEGSYTAVLFKKGENRILQKLGEEAIETILAMKSESKERCIEEIADLLYHLTVAMVFKEITWEDVENELRRRRK
jgi:phosphoribosyl-ATP pyrophosphohydrolase